MTTPRRGLPEDPARPRGSSTLRITAPTWPVPGDGRDLGVRIERHRGRWARPVARRRVFGDGLLRARAGRRRPRVPLDRRRGARPRARRRRRRRASRRLRLAADRPLVADARRRGRPGAPSTCRTDADVGRRAARRTGLRHRQQRRLDARRGRLGRRPRLPRARRRPVRRARRTCSRGVAPACCSDPTTSTTSGLFDERFFMYYEDTDLAWRGRARGWRYRYVPDAVLRHVHAATSVEGSPLFRHYVERNRLADAHQERARRLRGPGRRPLLLLHRLVRPARRRAARARAGTGPSTALVQAPAALVRVVPAAASPTCSAERRHAPRRRSVVHDEAITGWAVER